MSYKTWKEVKLNDICKIKHGYAFKGDFFSDVPTNNLLLTPGNFAIGGGFKADKFKYYNGDIPKDYVLKADDLIVTMTDLSKEGDTLGYSAKVPLDNSKIFLHNQRIGLVTVKDENYHIDFIYWLMRSEHYQKFVLGSATGATVKHTSPSKILAFKSKIPSLSIQKKISKTLSNYDDLIESNLKKIKLLEEKARLIYEEWFEFRKIDGKQISDEKISIVIMEDLLEKYMNGGWGKEELDGNYNSKAYVIRGTDIPDISKGNYRTLPLRFHTQSNLSSRNLNVGDISIEMSNGNINNVGRSFYFDRGTKDILNENVMCASFCKMIKPKNINVSYLLDQHLKYIHSTDKMLIYKSQGANGINNFRFEDMINEELIYVPENDLLKKLTNKFSTIYDLISTFRMQIKLLNESRDILLPRLLTGMIDLENMDIEV